MARIRSIKPEFWSDAKVAKLSLPARLLFIALWNFADDYGIGRALPREIGGFAFPHDDEINVKPLLDQLEKLDFVQLYVVDENPYYIIQNWTKHQKVDKPGKAMLPKPPESLARHSRKSRECLAQNPPLDLGSRIVDLGEGSINNDDKTRAREPESHPEDDGEKPHCPAKEISSYLDRYCWLLSAPQLHEILDEHDDPPPLLRDKPETWTEWICLAIKEASDRNAKNMAYLRKVIDSAREQQIPPGSKPTKAPFIPPPRQTRGPYGVSDDTIRDFLKESGVDTA